MLRRDMIQPSQLLFPLSCLVGGIMLQDGLRPYLTVWPFLACLAATVLMWRWPRVQSLGIGVSVLVLGMLLTGREQTRLTFADDGQWHVADAVVVSEAVEKPKTVAADLLMVSTRRKVKAYFWKDGRSLALRPGDGISLSARIENTDSVRLGTFAYGRFLLTGGFTGRCYVRGSDWQPRVLPLGTLPWTDRLRIRALRLRHQLLQRCRALAADDAAAAALVGAMTLGDRTALSSSQRAVFAAAGTSHILALSGLHMGILLGLFSLFPAYWRRSGLMVLLTVTLCWAFALLTGLSVSVVRSALMLTVGALAVLRGGRTSTVNVLCFAAIVILVVSPMALFDVGFQLSFLSVFSILTVVPVLDSLCPVRRLQRYPFLSALWQLVAVGIAAQVGTAPLVAHYFGQLPVWFVLSNVVAIPCAYAILWLGLCYLLLPVSWLGQVLLFVGSTMSQMLAAIASWPHATLDGLHPSALQTLLVYALIVTLYLLVVRVRGIKVRLL